MRKTHRLIMPFSLLLFAILACNFGGSTSSTTPSDTGGDEVLFQDDFSNANSGWDQYRDEIAITDYENSGYRIYVNEDNFDVWANPGRSFTDVSVEVSARKVAGPDENDFGIICRYQDVDNYYFFIIGSDGFYGIGMVDEGEQQLVGMEAMQFSDQISQGAATNLIRADCVGDRLSLYVNGTILADVRDNRLSNGDVGLMAGTFDEPGTDILFDDFIVRRP